MVVKPLLPVLGLAAFAHATYDVVEEISGYKFYHSGPTNAATKSSYETKFCHTALQKFSADTNVSDAACLSTLRALKASKTPEELLSHFDADIREADATWHAVVHDSTGAAHVAATADVVVVVPGITSLSFAAYYLSAYAQESYQKINAEHYINRDDSAPGTQEILEGWGGVTTHFSLATTDRGQFSYLPALPEFAIKVASDKILRDGTGTKFGVVDIALQDVVGPQAGLEEGEQGVHILSSVWYGDGAPRGFVEVEAEHVVVKIVNHALNAKAGYDNGAIVLRELLAGLCALFPTMGGVCGLNSWRMYFRPVCVVDTLGNHGRGYWFPARYFRSFGSKVPGGWLCKLKRNSSPSVAPVDISRYVGASRMRRSGRRGR
ncbi:hypothetical protein BU23DRAFT_654608 [Bimuria novae-zelandiae CBS 107.79]|uniref:Uncharacterized protein n=1 Tax=Bimuria novae-zelandiae CBS 107.79 TaxID=1447943 RepID=A0A6A5VMP4_9PLEO|nr:hypothetical protein BU23DRAFT_654608 [Bimuria novae-zelandiae CBS 107.79]